MKVSKLTFVSLLLIPFFIFSFGFVLKPSLAQETCIARNQPCGPAIESRSTDCCGINWRCFSSGPTSDDFKCRYDDGNIPCDKQTGEGCPKGLYCRTEESCGFGGTKGCCREETGPSEPPASPDDKQEVKILRPQLCYLTREPIVLEPGTSGTGIQTALGCFPTNPREIIEWVLKYAIMFAGGIGFLLMLWASFQIMTSAGDPDKLKAGQQLLGAAIAGILFIVFSLFLLRFIGFTILQIPRWQ